MILGTKARYAVMAMVDLALLESAGEPQSLPAISQRQELPLSYLEQLFPKLRKAGLVISVRGPGGGYELSKAADAITILDIVSAVDESLEMTRCGNIKEAGCMMNNGRCLTHALWEGLSNQISRYLHSVSLGSLVQGKRRIDNLLRMEADDEPDLS